MCDTSPNLVSQSVYVLDNIVVSDTIKLSLYKTVLILATLLKSVTQNHPLVDNHIHLSLILGGHCYLSTKEIMS